MFLLNSRLGQFSVSHKGFLQQAEYTPWEPLIPKLRGLFAEFLNESSLDRLGTFIPAYQCRFAVRSPTPHNNEAFLDGIGSVESPRENPRVSCLLGS